MQKKYLDESKGVQVGTWWDDISMIRGWSHEKTGYKTQKPEALLDRILKASSNENDLVLDCFVGSGTTAAVAEKLNRRWIACDLGRFAIHTTRKRLLSIPDVRPFVVQNLGKYERQLWLEDRSLALAAGDVAARHRAYIDFILQLYHATPIHGRTWLHGVKGGRRVHVGGVEGPVTAGDVTQLAAEFKKAMGSGKDAPTTNGVDVLGWDFAFEINEVARQQAADANIKMQFKRIPRDVMDKRAVEQGDISFFELAALGVDHKVKGREVTLTLSDFVIPPDDVPEEVRSAVASLVAVDRLLGGGLEQPGRYVSQPMADVPHAQGAEVGVEREPHVRGGGQVSGRGEGDRHFGQRHDEDADGAGEVITNTTN